MSESRERGRERERDICLPHSPRIEVCRFSSVLQNLYEHTGRGLPESQMEAVGGNASYLGDKGLKARYRWVMIDCYKENKHINVCPQNSGKFHINVHIHTGTCMYCTCTMYIVYMYIHVLYMYSVYIHVQH